MIKAKVVLFICMVMLAGACKKDDALNGQKIFGTIITELITKMKAP